MNQKQINSISYKALVILFSLVSLIPFHYLNVDIHGIPMHYVVLLVLVPVLIFLVYFNNRFFTGFDYALILLCFLLLISITGSINRINTIKSVLSFFLRGLGIAYLSEKLTKGKAEKTLDILVIVASIVAALGIVEFFTGWNPYFMIPNKMLHYRYDPRSGMSSSIGHPLALSAYLIMFLPYSLYIFVKEKSRIFKKAPVLIILTAVILTFSRSSWLACAFMLCIYLIYDKNYLILKRYWKYILLFTLLIMQPFLLSKRLQRTFSRRFDLSNISGSISATHRLAAYKTTWNVMKKYPLFGVGFGNYPEIHDEFRAYGTRSFPKTTDNIYLRFVCEIGLLPALAFFLVLIHWLRRISSNLYKPYILASTLGLVGFMFNQLFADLYYWMAPQMAFWLITGILSNYMEAGKKSY